MSESVDFFFVSIATIAGVDRLSCFGAGRIGCNCGVVMFVNFSFFNCYSVNSVVTALIHFEFSGIVNAGFPFAGSCLVSESNRR